MGTMVLPGAGSGGGGGGGGGWTLIKTVIVNAQTEIDVLSVFSDTYTEYDIEIIDFVPSGAASMTLQFGNAAGPTWEDSANYYWGVYGPTNSGSYNGFGSSAEASMTVFDIWTANADPSRTGQASLFIRSPTATTGKNIYGTVSHTIVTGDDVFAATFMGALLIGESYDSFRLQCEFEVISGMVKVYGR